MFRSLGPDRTSHHDRRLAGYLAMIAGIVNSAGLVVLGSFTSHVTGNVGRFAEQVADGNATLASVAAMTVVAFFVGAFVTSMAIESRVFVSMSRTSAVLLLLEATLVGTFVAIAGFRDVTTSAAPPMLLGAAMGLQNALVTRLSGAVVRTTHLTGVVTDLGIEVARWLRYWRFVSGQQRHLRFTVTSTPAVRPAPPKIALLGTIFAAFVTGSAAGAVLAARYSYLAFLPVVAVLVAGALYALLSGRSVARVPPEDRG
ncbi:MAG: putative transrane protein [Labilithrix sp.]|nr:putative transrane protein [Labilithrix sp.]